MMLAKTEIMMQDAHYLATDPEQPVSYYPTTVVVAPAFEQKSSSDEKPRRYSSKCLWVGFIVLAAAIIVAGVTIPKSKQTSSKAQESSFFPEEEEENIPDQVSFVNVGCYEPESSLDIHRLSSANPKNRAYECSKTCITRFFGVSDDICNCFVDVPQSRLSIGSCEFVAENENGEQQPTMELYFNERSSNDCSQPRTETVRNFLVEEDDAPFGFDIVSNDFRASPFELFKDECGTNIYEVQTEVSEGSQSLQTSVSEVKSFARSRRTERISSLSASASASYKSFLFSASAEVSASSDSE
jgi:hypothetical protein